LADKNELENHKLTIFVYYLENMWNFHAYVLSNLQRAGYLKLLYLLGIPEKIGGFVIGVLYLQL
jgi:hypothetical protein